MLKFTHSDWQELRGKVKATASLLAKCLSVVGCAKVC